MIGELEVPLPQVEPNWDDEVAPDPLKIGSEMSDQEDFEDDNFDDFDDDFDDDFEEELEDEYNFEDEEKFGDEDVDEDVGEPGFEGDLGEFDDGAEPLEEDGDLAEADGEEEEEEEEDDEFEDLDDVV